MARRVEVFTAGCPVCDETVKLVQSLSCASCEVTVYDLRDGCASNQCRSAASDYGIHRLPAVVVDGRLVSCCEGAPVGAQALQAAGVGAA